MRSRFLKIGGLFALLMLSILVIWFINRPEIVKIETLYHALPFSYSIPQGSIPSVAFKMIINNNPKGKYIHKRK